MLEAKALRMLVSGASDEEIAGVIEAKAQLDKDIARMTIEQTATRMAANLNTVMRLFDADGQIGKLGKEIGAIRVSFNARDREYTKHFQQLETMLARVEQSVIGLAARLDRVEHRLDRKRDRLDALEARVRRLEERGDGER